MKNVFGCDKNNNGLINLTLRNSIFNIAKLPCPMSSHILFKESNIGNLYTGIKYSFNYLKYIYQPEIQKLLYFIQIAPPPRYKLKSY